MLPAYVMVFLPQKRSAENERIPGCHFTLSVDTRRSAETRPKELSKVLLYLSFNSQNVPNFKLTAPYFKCCVGRSDKCTINTISHRCCTVLEALPEKNIPKE